MIFPISVAYISPMPPTPSGISDYSELLVPFLAEHMDIAVFYEGEEPPKRAGRYPVYPIDELYNRYSCYDLRLYQVGNSPYHQGSFAAIRRLPGVVVLHEPFLHHGLYGSSPVRFYRREVFYDLGRPDWESLKQLERFLLNDDRQSLIAIPLIGRILDSSFGIVVHSQTARRMIETYFSLSHRQAIRPEIRIIPQLMSTPGPYDVKECRARFRLPLNAFIVGMAGNIHPVKEPRVVVQAFARLVAELPEAHLLFVGEIYQEKSDILELARELGVAEKITLLGRVEPLEDLHQAIAACDVIINLRRTTIGETSSIALRSMALGKPVVVRNMGWFSELPDDTCIKVEAEEGVEKLAAVMLALGNSFEMRTQMGQRALRYIRQECDPRRVARQYADFLRDVYWNTVSQQG